MQPKRPISKTRMDIYKLNLNHNTSAGFANKSYPLAIPKLQLADGGDVQVVMLIDVPHTCGAAGLSLSPRTDAATPTCHWGRHVCTEVLG